MKVAKTYCAIRSELEEYTRNLTGMFFDLTERLRGLVGINHQEFLDTQAACGKIRQQLSESRHRLEAHRTGHGC
jgi:hypothetical protein